MVVQKVVPIAPVVAPFDISWRFKPLFMWMRILGIELDPTCNPFHQITYFYGLLLFLTCQWASISLTVYSFKVHLPDEDPSNNSNVTKSATYDWNVRIDVVNHFSLMSIVCPAFFYVAHNRRWIRLLDVMKSFHFAYCKRNRRGGIKIRNFLFTVGFVPILSETAIIMRHFKKSQETPHASTYEIAVWFFAFIAKVWPTSALVLFYSVAWQSAAFYGDIRQDVKLTNLTKVKEENIRKWKRSLCLADELVDRINDCFGLILLVSITHFFVEFIARSFYLVSNISRNQLDIISIVSMLSRIFLLWFIAYCPTKIHNNAIKVAISLRKSDAIDTNVKSQVSFLALDIIQNSPRISALSYFDVNVQLIPKLIGTTLTYLVILYQFQTSENDN